MQHGVAKLDEAPSVSGRSGKARHRVAAAAWCPDASFAQQVYAIHDVDPANSDLAHERDDSGRGATSAVLRDARGGATRMAMASSGLMLATAW